MANNKYCVVRILSIFIHLWISKTSFAQNIPLWQADQLQQTLQQNDTIVVINFWSTTCAPCIKEMPDLLAVKNKYKNKAVKFYFVSLDFKEDYPKKIKSFVQKKKWKGNFVWLNETNGDFICPIIDSNWSGAIPATVVYQQRYDKKKFWEGEITKSTLIQYIDAILNQTRLFYNPKK